MKCNFIWIEFFAVAYFSISPNEIIPRDIYITQFKTYSKLDNKVCHFSFGRFCFVLQLFNFPQTSYDIEKMLLESKRKKWNKYVSIKWKLIVINKSCKLLAIAKAFMFCLHECASWVIDCVGMARVSGVRERISQVHLGSVYKLRDMFISVYQVFHVKKVERYFGIISWRNEIKAKHFTWNTFLINTLAALENKSQIREIARISIESELNPQENLKNLNRLLKL